VGVTVVDWPDPFRIPVEEAGLDSQLTQGDGLDAGLQGAEFFGFTGAEIGKRLVVLLDEGVTVACFLAGPTLELIVALDLDF
jgi:hypothetical protein